jgi:formate dehydrogenase iron-sulfur subunit
MAQGKSIMVDTTRCTACRGCQVACKQWNGLPGTKTKQVGTYQNPQDLSADTWKLVRFSEGRRENGKPFWYFFSDQCRHCLEPPCLESLQSFAKDGGYRDEATGAVIYTAQSKKAPLKQVVSMCPYNIPRQDPKTKVLRKCTLCFDRITNNQVPACVKSCPTGALVFGERDQILQQVATRVEELRAAFPQTKAIDADDVRVIYLVTDDPAKYHKFAAG